MARSDRSDDVLAVASTAHLVGQPLAPVTAAAPALARTVVGAPAPAAAATVALETARYRPLGLLGEGGMGRVEHVWDADLMRHVAVKRLRPDLADDAALVRRFLWEARVSAYLDHPNIAPVHDVGLSDGQLYFTMARVAGVALDEVIDQLRAGDRDTLARFPLPRRLRLFIQVAQAAAFAHARGVLHRDLKPANIMLGEHGEVRVMDWGLAMPLAGAVGDPLRLMMPDGVERGSGSGSAGTPRYMSPEQARGEPLDARSDVYALGVILYELCALVPPVEGATVSEVLANLRDGRTRPLRQAWPAAPHPLRAVVARAMAFKPGDRYASAAALADDVERVVDGHTPAAETASMLTRMARFYVSRDPAIAHMHVWEIDFWAGGAFVFGIGLGALLARFIGVWAWVVLVAGLVIGVPPTIHYLGLQRRRRDEGG